MRRLLAELVVIVAGVLIALAIDEWRENIENASLERENIQQLIVDLRATEDSMTRVASLNAILEDAASRLVRTFESGKNIEPDQVSDLLSVLYDFDNPVPVLGAFEALVATGDLRLIRDTNTRSAITQYLSVTRDYFLIPIYDFEERYRDNVDRILTLAVAHGFTPLGGDNAEKRNAEPNVGAFLANDEAYFIALNIIRLRGEFVWYRESLAESARKLREQLEKQSN